MAEISEGEARPADQIQPGNQYDMLDTWQGQVELSADRMRAGEDESDEEDCSGGGGVYLVKKGANKRTDWTQEENMWKVRVGYFIARLEGPYSKASGAKMGRALLKHKQRMGDCSPPGAKSCATLLRNWTRQGTLELWFHESVSRYESDNDLDICSEFEHPIRGDLSGALVEHFLKEFDVNPAYDVASIDRSTVPSSGPEHPQEDQQVNVVDVDEELVDVKQPESQLGVPADGSQDQQAAPDDIMAWDDAVAVLRKEYGHGE